MRNYCESFEDVEKLLRHHGVSPTRQRAVIARVLFSRPRHLSAEDVWTMVNDLRPAISRATVYNTLNLLSERGLIRQVIAQPGKVYYDSNTVPHHHLYDIDTGELTDIGAEEIGLSRLPALPADMVAEGVDIIVRVRSKSRPDA
jgi:Fur family iron response transcriptional regulator